VNSLGAIAVRAAESGLPFVLAGGHAVIAHGHPRNTFDIDLIIRRADQAIWADLARGMGYSFHREGPTFLQFNPPNDQTLPLDLMLVSDDTFAKLLAEAVPAPASAAGAKVVSLQHLLALKCHAIKHGHEGRIVKDAEDVIQLALVNKLDVDEPIIRDLFMRHGTVELYEKVRRLCRQS
jgi:predicted nucleotidyltransferase